ncbi:T9SS type A sorting domain-containing protein [bacterium]|nr:T9SS type A sorting domain-containing protein [FCB group bacterium]MBL7190279.1 T9SS type A sorting domain-containing protein [bacterium]
MRKPFIIIAVTLFFAVCAMGNGAYFAFNGASNQKDLNVQINSSNAEGLELQLDAEGVIVESITLEYQTFTRLLWGNSGVSGAIGQPELPVYRAFVEIPFGANVQFEILQSSFKEYSLGELGAIGRVAPVQPPVEKLPGAKLQFTMDEKYYSTDSYSNQPIAEIVDYPVIRGHQMAVIEIRLVDYNPVRNMVRIYDNLNIRLSFQGGDMAKTAENLERYSALYFDRLIDKTALNSGVFETDALPNPPLMIIVYYDLQAYHDALLPLVEWRESKGIETIMVSTGEIGGSNVDIQNYLIEAYFTWVIPPTTVLLVGDSPQIPHWIGQGSGSPETDLYYSSLDGDYFPDIGVSRLSCTDAYQLSVMIDKILEYEQAGWSGNDDWEKHAVFMASNDNWGVSEGTHNFVISHYLEPDGYTCDRLYCHTYSATTQQVTNAFNEGRSQGTFSGHGSTTSWADGPPFSQGNVLALVNEVYPFIQSYACLTGKFTIGECFGETWIRAAHGALAFWGSSVNSYWGEDDILEKGLYQGFFDNQYPGDDVNFTWIDGMTIYGKMFLYNYYGPSGMIQRYFEMYNILGDGSVDLWTDVPNIVTVNHPSVVFLGTQEVMVSVSGYPDWAMVCAQSSVEPEVWAMSYVNASGTAQLHFSPAPSQPGEMVFTVTGHDVHPYIEAVPLTPASGPYVVFEEYVIDDANGWNPNGQLDYNETTMLDFTLQNVGVEPANGVWCTLRSDDEYITIDDSSAYFGNIGANSSVAIDDAFQITLAPDVPDEHNIQFDVFVYQAWEEWTSFCSITAHAPDIIIERVTVDDSVGGNGNSALDPGESATLEIFLQNDGSSPVIALELDLSTVDPYVTLITTAGAYGNMLAGETASALFNLEVAGNCPQDYNVDFTGIYNGGHALTGEIEFTLIVGNILYLPTGPDNYGYCAYDIHDAPILPLYDWIEIDPGQGGAGTVIPFTQDDQTLRFDLPFTFTYYGQDYTRVSICSNGWIAMGETNNTDYSNSSIPNGDGPPAMIAPFWEDMSPQQAGVVAYYYDAAQNIYIIEFSNVPQYMPPGTYESFQMLLYDPAYYTTVTGDGEIKFQYQLVSDPSACTVGIENHNQDDGVQYLYDENYDIHAAPIEAGMAVMFTTGREAANLTITLEPMPPGIVIPQGGGSFSYSLEIANNGATPAVFDGWIDVTLPSGIIYGPIILRTGLNLGAGASISRDLQQYVPAGAPAGTYSYNGYAGIHPNVIYSQDSFPFEKLGTDAGSGSMTGWDLFGWDDELTPNLAVPEKYSLSQNYPNPFNPVTSIEFTIPEAGNIKLAVYNIEGRLVKTLTEGDYQAGYYTVTWNAKEASSGVYFYRLDAPGFSQVKKCILMK